MASPQVENGYTKMAHEIMEALMRTNLSAYQGRVIMAVIRLTYGWHKKEDYIKNKRIVELTGLKKSHVSRTVSELVERNMLSKSGNKIGFNKDYTQWKKLPIRVTVTNRGNKVTDWGNRTLPNRVTAKPVNPTRTGADEGLKIYKKKLYKKNDGLDVFLSGKDKDPRIQIILDHYANVFEEVMGCSPTLSEKDEIAVIAALEKRTVDEIRNLIEFAVTVYFRPKEYGGRGLSGSLRSCFGPFYLQEYDIAWQKRKWEYGDQPKPVTHERWWR